MSLRAKILTVYIPVSLAPLLVVGVANYARYTSLTDRLLKTELISAAEQTARIIGSRHAELQAELQRVVLASPGEAEPSAQHFRRIELVDELGGTRVLHAGPLIDAGACDAGANEVRISVTLPAAGASATAITAVGTVGLDALVPAVLLRGTAADEAQTLVIDHDAGGLLYDPHCPGVASAAALLPQRDGTLLDGAALGTGSGMLQFEERGRQRSAAYVRLAAPSWTIVTSAPTDAFSLARQGAALVLALLAFGLLGALIFHALTGRLLRSLEQVIHAADRIGDGDFTPWLPPPGDDETGRLSHALGSMVVRLKRLMRETEHNRQLAVVGEVSSHLAHEIRNPLSAITLNLQSVRREVRRGSVPQDLPEVLDVCLDEISRLEGVVENVLRLGRAESGNVRECGLHEIVNAALAVTMRQLEARGIEVAQWHLAQPDGVRCDADQMRGVVLNLLRNAFEAMPHGGALRIWTTLVAPPSGEPLIRLHVADEGPGVPPALRERIFEPFFTTKPNGSGLGLASAASAAAAAGGRLFVEKRSELETGAEFVLELPLAASPPAEGTTPAPQPAAARRRRRRTAANA